MILLVSILRFGIYQLFFNVSQFPQASSFHCFCNSPFSRSQQMIQCSRCHILFSTSPSVHLFFYNSLFPLEGTEPALSHWVSTDYTLITIVNFAHQKYLLAVAIVTMRHQMIFFALFLNEMSGNTILACLPQKLS